MRSIESSSGVGADSYSRAACGIAEYRALEEVARAQSGRRYVRTEVILGAAAEVIARQDLWRDAEKTYADVAGKYIKAWWMGDLPRPDDHPEPLTRDAMREILDKRGRQTPR